MVALPVDNDITDVYEQLATSTIKSLTQPSISSDKEYYLQLSYGERVIQWIETEFYIPELLIDKETNQRRACPAMQLEPYHKAVLREAFRQTPDGKFVYDFILWSDIKKSIKSCIAAAVVLYRALHTDWGSFKIVANDLKQADSRVFFYIRRSIELNPKLSAQANIRNYKIIFDNKSVIEAIPVDPDGEAGGNDDMIEYTELHGFTSKAALKLWTETTLSPTKSGYSQRWADTYAGMSGESPILEPLYEQVCKPENMIDVGIEGLEIYSKAGVLVLWNTTPRCLTWQTPDYYARESVVLLPNEFLRVHRNQWTSSVSAFVQPEWWNACKGDIPELAPSEPIVLVMDAGVTNDCFAIVGVCRRGTTVYVLFVRVWRPPHGGSIDFSEPEKFVREMCATHNVIQIGYDPYQLHDMATRLRNSGIGWVRAFPQGQDRLVADKQLYDCIVNRTIVHGDHPDLSEHVKNANAKAEGENKLRIVKRADHLKIDACVALSMANSEVRRLNI